jgi:CheY-specific phosphatase CheX
MTSLPAQEIAEMVRSATRDVFQTMLNLPLEELPFHEDPDPPEPFDGVVSMVGIGGPWIGTGRISSPPELACRMAAAMLMTECESIDESVLDAYAEIGNMIIGNVKTTIEEKLGSLALSVPTVIFGLNYRTHSSGVNSWTVVPFTIYGLKMEVSFCLRPARVAVFSRTLQRQDAIPTP